MTMAVRLYSLSRRLVVHIEQWLFGVAKPTSIGEEEPEDSDCYGGVGNIEDWAEEFEILSTYERHPFRPVGTNDWAIEHIHHFTMEQACIATAFGEKHCFVDDSTFAEYYAVEDTVEDIADCAGYDKGETPNDTLMVFAFVSLVHEPEQPYHSHYPDESQYQFTCFAGKFHTERHSIIFYEIQVYSIAEQVNSFTYSHI